MATKKKNTGFESAMYAFVIDEMGGEEAVKAEFLRSQLRAQAEQTFDSVLSNPDLETFVRGMTVNELVNVVRPPASRKSPQNRATPEEKQAWQEDVLTYLGEHPEGATRQDLLDFLPESNYHSVMTSLRKDNKVKVEGVKRSTRYFLAKSE